MVGQTTRSVKTRMSHTFTPGTCIVRQYRLSPIEDARALPTSDL